MGEKIEYRARALANKQRLPQPASRAVLMQQRPIVVLKGVMHPVSSSQASSGGCSSQSQSSSGGISPHLPSATTTVPSTLLNEVQRSSGHNIEQQQSSSRGSIEPLLSHPVSTPAVEPLSHPVSTPAVSLTMSA